jgi:hypothetical protein
MTKKLYRWNYLLLGLVSVALFMTLLHRLSARMTGFPGELIERNQRQQLEVDAYFYSEVGDLSEFLNDEQGRYGRHAFHKSLEETDRKDE